MQDMPQPRHGAARVARPDTIAHARPVRHRRAAAFDAVAHELRTPLTALMLGSDLLVDGRLRGRLRQDVIHDVAAEVQRLADTVEDLLALSGPPEAPDEPQPVDLAALARDELNAAAGTAPTTRFRLHVHGSGPLLTTNERLVRHLVHDLVAAGVAAAGNSGLVELTVALDHPLAGRVRMTARGRSPRAGQARGASPRWSPIPRLGALREAAIRLLAGRLGARVRHPKAADREILEVELVDARAGDPGRS